MRLRLVSNLPVHTASCLNIVVVAQNKHLDYNFIWICRITSHKTKVVVVHVAQSCSTTGCSVCSVVCFSVLAKVENLVSV